MCLPTKNNSIFTHDLLSSSQSFFPLLLFPWTHKIISLTEQKKKVDKTRSSHTLKWTSTRQQWSHFSQRVWLAISAQLRHPKEQAKQSTCVEEQSFFLISSAVLLLLTRPLLTFSRWWLIDDNQHKIILTTFMLLLITTFVFAISFCSIARNIARNHRVFLTAITRRMRVSVHMNMGRKCVAKHRQNRSEGRREERKKCEKPRKPRCRLICRLNW